MKTVQLKDQAVKKLKQRYPLIHIEDLKQQVEPTTEWVRFTDAKGRFVATGYLGKQNKGVGWVLSWNEQVTINQEFFEKIFAKSNEQRDAYYRDEWTNAFRLFNGEGDGLGGLTIDYYDQYLVLSWYNQTLYTYRALILAAIQATFSEVKGIYEKIRFESSLPESNFCCGEEAPEPLLIQENGINYAVYLNEGLMTGIFLDQKEVRGQLVDGAAMGRTVLNMFSYTGAFSVAAAMGGAQTTTSVDLAKRSLSKTKEQFEVNHLTLDENRIVVMDVFEYFRYALRKNLTYDVIILDPPSFARNKKQTFSVAKNYGDLVEAAVDILSQKGTLIASTNAANVSFDRYREMVEKALQQKQVAYRFTETYRLPADFHVNKHFPEGNYLKVLFIEIEK